MKPYGSIVFGVLALSGCAVLEFGKMSETALGDFTGNDFGALSQGLNIFEGSLSGICLDDGAGSTTCPESDDRDSFQYTIPSGFESVSAVLTTDSAGLGRHMGVDMSEIGVPTGGSTNFFTVTEFGTSENIVAPDNLILGDTAVMQGGESYSVFLHFRPTIPQGTHTVNWRFVINVQPPV